MLVNTANDLQNIRNNLAANYALGGNIDASTIADFTSLGGEALTTPTLGSASRATSTGAAIRSTAEHRRARASADVGLFGYDGADRHVFRTSC